MEDIYGQTEMERNSIVEIPDGMAEQSGNVLYSWLGSIWRSVHKGDSMVRGLQSARGIRIAQMCLDVLEAAMLQDRNGAPVFHRELWHPVVIRLSTRNKSQENMLEIGGTDKTIGPQPAGSAYGEGTVFKIGKMADYANHVTYPVDPSIVGGAVTIVDNIVNPTVYLERGEDKDFDIRNGTIVFPKDGDPLADGSPFERYDIPSDNVEKPDEHDTEAILWASDVLLDKNYIADHISYALGADAPSSAIVKRILNAAWSAVTSGLTPELIRTLMAAMLNIPVIQGERETVTEIASDEDGNTIVRTDVGTYKVSKKATLRRCVQVGSVMARGELLDESLRIYPFLNVIAGGVNPRASVNVRHGLKESARIASGDSSSESGGYELPQSCFPIQYTESGSLTELSLGPGDVDYGYYEGYDYDVIGYPWVEQIRLYRGVDVDGSRLPDSERFVHSIGKFSASTLAYENYGNDIAYDGMSEVLYGGVAPEVGSYPVLVVSQDSGSSHDSSSFGSSSSGSDSSSDSSSFGSSSSGSDSSSGSSGEDSSGGEDGYDERTGFSVPLEQDIPSVVIPKSIIRAKTEHGVFAMWGASEVRSVVSGGKRRLLFDIGGDADDVASFWEDIWAKADASGADMESIIGEEGTIVSPAAFILKNLVGANTLFVVVDRSQIDDDSMMRDPMFFDMLMDAVPSAVRLFLVEHLPVGSDDNMDMDDAGESATVSAAIPGAVDHVACGLPSGMSGRDSSFGEFVSMRFVRPSPSKTRGHKEEEI